MTGEHVTYARRRLTSLVTAWRTGIAKAFEHQYADQLHRRHRSASCSHLLAVARPRIGRGDADQPRYGRLLPEDRRVRQLRRRRRLQPPRLMRVNTQVTLRHTSTKENRNGSDGSDLPDTEERRGI
jgi:hypothetical protein